MAKKKKKFKQPFRIPLPKQTEKIIPSEKEYKRKRDGKVSIEEE